MSQEMSMFRRKSKLPLSRREVVAKRHLSEDMRSRASGTTYRRSRTLMHGTTSDPIEKSERLASHDLRRRRRKLVVWLVTLVVMIGTAIYTLGQLIATVKVVVPGSTQVIAGSGDEARLVGVLDSYLAARPVERLRFALNAGELHAYFAEHAPEVQSVQVVSGSKLAEATLRVSFRQPVIKWVSGGKEYYVDGLGVSYTRNYFDEPVVQVEDLSGVIPELGHESVNRQLMSFIGQSISLFDKSGYAVSRVVLPEGTIRQVEISVQGRGFPIKMTIDRGVESQTARAVGAMRHLEAKGVVPSSIDARVDQRVYFK